MGLLLLFPVMRSLLMTRLASRFGAANLIRRDRPLTREELFRVVPSVFSEDKHESRSERYTYIPTISCWRACSAKASSRSLPVRPACVTRAVGNTPSICCVCGVRGRLPVNRCRKLSCLTLTMAPVRIRCCRDYFVRFVRMVLSAASRLARCVCRTRGRGKPSNRRSV